MFIASFTLFTLSWCAFMGRCFFGIFLLSNNVLTSAVSIAATKIIMLLFKPIMFVFQKIPALNGTHYFTVRTDPVIVTDKIRIKPSKSTFRACFKLELKGCDPTSKYNVYTFSQLVIPAKEYFIE